MPSPSKIPITSPYNWRATRAPERPYVHAYHTSLVDKIFLCRKPNPQTGAPLQVYLTFEQALERIQAIDAITRGIPKIIYLVGWQFEGHDLKYPDWSQVNEHLKRSQDPTAAHSLRWLMKAAREYNTTVSLHINMMDAYENSPLWDSYKRSKLICGKGGVWDGEQAYLIDYTREWDLGFAQERIDNLCRMLPLVDAGTVHIDAFWPTGDNFDEFVGTMRRIVRYWRNKGIDVTTEGIPVRNLDKGLIGLVPMVWHLNYGLWSKADEFSEDDYLDIPASLFCAARDHSYRGMLFGASMQGESLGEHQMEEYLAQFCLNTLPWQFLNHYERIGLVREGDVVLVEFDDGVIVRVNLARGHRYIRQDDVTIQDGEDVFVPALWLPDLEIIAYSREGYADRKWRLPYGWDNVSHVNLRYITSTGFTPLAALPVTDEHITLSLEPGHAVSITRP